ncbi:MAG TPA: ribokinase [Mucilaginibacter sp.]|nr:ribokinase [Mucilaginibacter sp.]
MSSIVVIGSSNTDMVVKTDHIPVPGETIIGGEFFIYPGGKGANQAVAAARLGGQVTLIASIGDDIFGRRSIELIKGEGIDVSYIISEANTASGVALITVDKKGENCITVAPGSNATLYPPCLQKSLPLLQQASIVLIQLEIPLDTVIYVAEVCKDQNNKLILNPAPACFLPDSLFPNIDIITPNEKEAEMLTGIRVENLVSATQAARSLKNKGVKTVIITMGKEGALIVTDEYEKLIPSIPVEAIDTTGAGDVFNGALAVAIAAGKDIAGAVAFACKAAAISVTGLGAQSSAPKLNEMEMYL